MLEKVAEEDFSMEQKICDTCLQREKERDAVIFSWYAIVGGNDGFAILWILLVTSVAILAFGFGEGIALSVYFAVFLFAFFYMRFRLVSKYQSENRQYKLKLMSYNDELKREVKKQTAKIEDFSFQLIDALAKTIDAKDKYTNGHLSIRRRN